MKISDIPLAVQDRSSSATNDILSPAQHFATVQDKVLGITGHLQIPGKQMLSRTPGLLCRTVPVSLLVVRTGAAVPRKGTGGTSQQKSLLSFPSTVPRENTRFMLPLHLYVFTC